MYYLIGFAVAVPLALLFLSEGLNAVVAGVLAGLIGAAASIAVDELA